MAAAAAVAAVATAAMAGGCDKPKPVGSAEVSGEEGKKQGKGGVGCGDFCRRLMGCSPEKPSGLELQKAVADCQAKCEATPPPPNPEGRILHTLKGCVAKTDDCAGFRACAQKAFRELAGEMEPQKREDLDATYKVPVGKAPVVGPDTALVTVVGFLDAQCGYCARGQKVLAKALEEFPKKLRVVFRDYPLRPGSVADKAAQAALSVYEQKGADAYWKYQTKTYGSARLDEARLLALAKEVGADPKKVEKDLEAGKHEVQVKRNLALGRKLGVDGTPTFFINGKKYPGFIPLEQFKQVLVGHAKKAEELIEQGVERKRIYEKLIEKGHEKIQYIEGQASAGEPKDLDPKAVFKVPVAPYHPQKGPAGALVTVVLFTEFQCPFCRRLATTLDKLHKEYPTQVRVVFRNLPLPMHPRAFSAAESSLVVHGLKGDEGFWTYHDKLFQSQDDLSSAKLEDLAKEVGVDVKKYRKALAEHKYRSRVKSDLSLAEKLGVRGAPQMFINGKPLGGAQPYQKVKSVVERELQAAKALMAKQGDGGSKGIYAKIIEDGHTKPVYR